MFLSPLDSMHSAIQQGSLRRTDITFGKSDFTLIAFNIIVLWSHYAFVYLTPSSVDE